MKHNQSVGTDKIMFSHELKISFSFFLHCECLCEQSRAVMALLSLSFTLHITMEPWVTPSCIMLSSESIMAKVVTCYKS